MADTILRDVNMLSMETGIISMMQGKEVIAFASFPIVLCFSETQSCLTYEPGCEKTGLRGFRSGPTQTGLYSRRRWLKPGNFGFR